MTRTAVVIPLRGLHGGKSRLAPAFDPAQRAAMIAAMARHVIESVRISGIADTLLIVSRDPSITDHLGIDPRGIEVVTQPDSLVGLNAGIDLGRIEAMRRGAERIVVLSADLPQLEASDLEQLTGHAGIVLATDHAGVGTNALMLAGPDAISGFRFQFGAESRSLHADEARRLGFAPTCLDVPGLALDLDTPGDWDMLTPETRQELLDAVIQHRPLAAISAAWQVAFLEYS